MRKLRLITIHRNKELDIYNFLDFYNQEYL